MWKYIRRGIYTLAVTFAVGGMSLIFVAVFTDAFPVPPYITVESLDLTFTEREYHQRVQRQIREQGWDMICVVHLRSLDSMAKTYTVDNARMNLVIVEECENAR